MYSSMYKTVIRKKHWAPMQETRQIERLWTDHHRSTLHSPSSWSPACPTICLTYAGSGSGFHGPAQMAEWCEQHPDQLHSLHPSQLARFDNRLERIGLVVDRADGRLTEECILSFFHHEVLDWLVPGVQPCNRQLEIPLVFAVQYGHDDKLCSVRVYWDQAMVLKQILGKKDPADLFAQLPILTSKQACGRLVGPSPQNSNPLLNPAESCRPAPKKTVLNGMKSLLTDLPDAPITPARHRKVPTALESKVFDQEEEPSKPSTSAGSVHPSQDSHIIFDDTVPEVKPVGTRLKDNIFDPPQSGEPVPITAHSIPVNKDRMESHVFDDTNPFHPAYPIDLKRLQSHIFDPEDPSLNQQKLDPHIISERRHFVSHLQFNDQTDETVVKPAIEPSLVVERRQLVSHVFDYSPSVPFKPSVVPSSRRTNESQFSLAADEAPVPISCNKFKRLESQFSVGSSFELGKSASPGVSVATKSTQEFAFKSKIVFGE